MPLLTGIERLRNQILHWDRGDYKPLLDALYRARELTRTDAGLMLQRGEW